MQKVRAGLVMGSAWAALWAIGFGLAALGIGALDPQSMDEGESAAGMAAIGATVGMIAGIGYALLLGLGGSREGQPVGLLRGLLCGASGGAILPLLTPMPDTNALLTVPVGAMFGIGVLILGRAEAGAQASAQYVVDQARELVRDITGAPAA